MGVDEIVEEGVWMLEFNGCCSLVGSGARVVLIPPLGKIYPILSNGILKH